MDFHPFAGMFISKSCLSPHINKLMINDTKNTSANEWCFDEGCEKSPPEVIFSFLHRYVFVEKQNTRTSIINLIQYNDASKIVLWK